MEYLSDAPRGEGTGWRAAYSERFLVRAIQRPARPVRLTDEQIALLPEPLRGLALMSRSLGDAAAALRSFHRGGEQ